MSGVDVSIAHVCGQKADTSSNYCDNSATWQETFQFLSNVSRFLDCFFLEITTISYFWLSQASAATYWKYGGKYYMGFAGNLLGFPAVKEFLKSVKNLRSYCHEFGVQFFGPTL